MEADFTARYHALDQHTAQRVQQLMQQSGANLRYAMAAIALVDLEVDAPIRPKTRRGLLDRLGLKRRLDT